MTADPPPPNLPDDALHLASGTVCAVTPGGSGPRPGPSDGVTVRYRAWDDDGFLVADVADPAIVIVSDFPPGPAEVLQLMSAGATAVLRALTAVTGEAGVYELHLDAVEVRGAERVIPEYLRSPSWGRASDAPDAD